MIIINLIIVIFLPFTVGKGKPAPILKLDNKSKIGYILTKKEVKMWV